MSTPAAATALSPSGMGGGPEARVRIGPIDPTLGACTGSSPKTRTRTGVLGICAPSARRGTDAGRHHEAPGRCLTLFRHQLTVTPNSKKLRALTRLMLSRGPFRQGPPSFPGPEMSFVRAERIVWVGLVLGWSVSRISLRRRDSRKRLACRRQDMQARYHMAPIGDLLHRKLCIVLNRSARDVVQLRGAVEWHLSHHCVLAPFLL